MTTRATTWLAQTAVVLALAVTGSAAASKGLLAGNSCRGKNPLEGGLRRASASVSAEVHRGCGRACEHDAAEDRQLLVHNASAGQSNPYEDHVRSVTGGTQQNLPYNDPGDLQ